MLRILDKRRALFELSDLGMPPDTLAIYETLTQSPYGMVICAGPTGSGKTTTLYATLTQINSDEINVMTVEDPVEYVFPSVNQIQINEQAGITFAGGLRSILRQDPDAILVGEIRDVETARIAVQSALTGHLVLSSLHATDAVSALHRFLDMGIESFLIASLGCSAWSASGSCAGSAPSAGCRTSRRPTSWRSGRRPGMPPKDVFFHGEGCVFCAETGYQGRIGVYEVLRVTDEMKSLIVANATHDQLREEADRGGHGAAPGPGAAARRARRHHHRRDHAYDLRPVRGLGAMAQFKYLAVAADGTKLRATTEAMSVDALRNELLARQLDVVKIS